MFADLRTDRAGESGVVCIYKGVLHFAREPSLRASDQHHLAKEQNHLRLIEALLPPSALQPLPAIMATGRVSHTKGCRYNPALREGESACPYTTLYWKFLMPHEPLLAKNARMALQVKNVARMTGNQKQAVVPRADAIRRGKVGGNP